MVVFTAVKKEELKRQLKGFLPEELKTIYEERRLRKKGVIVILFTSGKLVLQGKEEEVEQLAAELEKAKIGQREKELHFLQEKGWVIGSDEALKGDSFGGLIVAAVKADDNLRITLMELGVKDSKKMSDAEVLQMAEKIKQKVPCVIKSLTPEEYNQFQGNVTVLLNKLHEESAVELKPGKHIIDKYPGCNVGDLQTEKAESKYLEVAAASVLARAAGLAQLDYLSKEAGFTIPKGSTHVQFALEEMKKRNLNPRQFVKLHFSNVQKML